jgi:hypothetical protein
MARWQCGCVALFAAIVALCGPTRSTADEAEDKAVKFVEGLEGLAVQNEKKPGKPVTEVILSGDTLRRRSFAAPGDLPRLHSRRNSNLNAVKHDSPVASGEAVSDS